MVNIAVNGSLITLTFPPVSNVTANVAGVAANLINMVVLNAGGGGSSTLKGLSDVNTSNGISNGEVLTVNTNGTSNTSDDSYYFTNPAIDGGSF